jgi:hypothetical protein
MLSVGYAENPSASRRHAEIAEHLCREAAHRIAMRFAPDERGSIRRLGHPEDPDPVRVVPMI